MPWPDALTYIRSGASLWRSGRIDSDLVMPLYPAVIGFIGPTAVLWLQIVLSAGFAMLAYALALDISGSIAAARVAGLIMALDPVTAFYTTQRLTETLYTVLLAAAVLTWYRARYAWGMLLFVLSLMVRPTIDLLGPFLVLAFLWVNERRLTARRAFGQLALYAVIYVAVMAPWWWHNYQKYGTFVRLNLGDGIVCRVEQNEVFDVAGIDWKRLEPIMTEFRDVADPVQRNQNYRDAALRYVQENPGKYVVFSIRRFFRFWSPVMDQSDEFLHSRKLRAVSLMATLPVLVGFVLALAASTRRLLMRMLPVLLVIAYLTAVHVATHALVRYRVPLTPLVAAISAMFWSWLIVWGRRQRQPAVVAEISSHADRAFSPGASKEASGEPRESPVRKCQDTE
ncbi:MAG TPA: hypothetical protein VE621_09200 [Bryobacteraceae bacterium]|nr:hypothetical protein [Bryobacteraceae bacterium]